MSSPFNSQHTSSGMVPSPLQLPFTLTLGAMPLVYALGLGTGNVSWVDRSWPFWPVVVSGMVVYWGVQHASHALEGNFLRMYLMLGLQVVWSIRLTRHAIKRDFYDLTSEDYRYTQFRKLVPAWVFQITHIFVIAIAQPALLFTLCLPLYWVLRLPNASGSINSWDFALVLTGLSLVLLEHKADSAMYRYQTGKYSTESKDIVSPSSDAIAKSKVGPKPASYPRAFHPGFITSGLFRYSRHPNFAAEQLFWVNQALFAVNAGRYSGLPKDEWMSFGYVFGPCFALSLLFCSSTFLTEWITTKKYPTYKAYKRLVGQFLPQETVLVRLWAALSGQTKSSWKQVYDVPPKKL